MGSSPTLVQLNIFCYLAAALLIGISVVVTFLRLQQIQRNRTTAAKDSIGEGIPSDLPPAAAGLLVRGNGRMVESNVMAATVIDLAQRGYIAIISAPALVEAGLARPHEAFVLLRLSEAIESSIDFLRPFETRLLDILFQPAFKNAVPLPLALRTYRTERKSNDYAPIVNDVRMVLANRGLIDIRQRGLRFLALGLLIPAIVACLGLLVYFITTPALFVDWAGLTTLAACAALAFTMQATLVAYSLRLNTSAGRQEAQRWQAYQNILRTGSEERDGAYALAFGMVTEILSAKFEQSPAWLVESPIEIVRRDDLPRPEEVSDSAGQLLILVQPNAATPPDLERTRELLTMLVTRLTSAMTPPDTGRFS